MKSLSAEASPEKLEEDLNVGKAKRKISDLTSLYGTKKQRKVVCFDLYLLNILCDMKYQMEILRFMIERN